MRVGLESMSPVKGSSLCIFLIMFIFSWFAYDALMDNLIGFDAQIPYRTLNEPLDSTIPREVKIVNYESLSNISFTLENLLFLHIPKTGGTYITQHYLQNKSLNEQNYGGSDNYIAKFWDGFSTARYDRLIAHGPLPCPPQHIPPGYFTPQENPYRGKFVFCVIRPILQRVVSAFRFQFRPHFEDERFPCNAAGLNTFIQFAIPKLISSDDGVIDRWMFGCHWIPQHQFIFDSYGKRICHFVLRFEHLDEDMSLLEEKFHFKFKAPQERANTASPGCLVSIWDLTDESIQLLMQYYSADEELFQNHFPRFVFS